MSELCLRHAWQEVAVKRMFSVQCSSEEPGAWFTVNKNCNTRVQLDSYACKSGYTYTDGNKGNIKKCLPSGEWDNPFLHCASK